MAVSLPDECRVGAARFVGMTERLSDLERVRARSNHERGERVAEVVELEPGDVFPPTRVGLLSCSFDRLGEDVGAEVAGRRSLNACGHGFTSSVTD